jgi:hypothetical protein
MFVPGLGWALAGRNDGQADSGMGLLNFVGGVFLTAAGIQLLVGIPLLADGIVESRENRPPPPFSLVVHSHGAGFQYTF